MIPYDVTAGRRWAWNQISSRGDANGPRSRREKQKGAFFLLLWNVPVAENNTMEVLFIENEDAPGEAWSDDAAEAGVTKVYGGFLMITFLDLFLLTEGKISARRLY